VGFVTFADCSVKYVTAACGQCDFRQQPTVKFVTLYPETCDLPQALFPRLETIQLVTFAGLISGKDTSATVIPATFQNRLCIRNKKE
jgi:hypothetical protein